MCKQFDFVLSATTMYSDAHSQACAYAVGNIIYIFRILYNKCLLFICILVSYAAIANHTI